MKLVPEAKQATRLWSVRLAMLSAALGAVEASLPLWESTLPDGLFAALASVVGVGAAVSRVIKQELPRD